MILKPLTDRSWKGYNFDELREQIAVNEARIMVQSKKIERQAIDMKPPKLSSDKSAAGIITTILTYVDYLALGVSLFRKIRPLISALKSAKSAK